MADLINFYALYAKKKEMIPLTAFDFIPVSCRLNLLIA
jgi:hypothetical protein